MNILVSIVVVIAVVLLALVLLRSKREVHARTYTTHTTSEQIPSIVSKLQRTGRDGSYVVFMFSIPNNRDDTLPNLQYSIENGRLGFDWVLLAPQNVKDGPAVLDFINRLGHSASKRKMNNVHYLRAEGNGIEDLGPKILSEYYHLAPEAKLELIVEGFDMKE